MTLLSPGIESREIDLTSSIQSNLSTNGSFAGKFTWGPVAERVRVSREEDLIKAFGSPVNESAVDFLTAASFLAYSSALDVVRIGNQTDMKNAVVGGSAVAILNDDAYDINNLATNHFVAKYPGSLGDSLAISVCLDVAGYDTALPGVFTFPVAPRSKVITYTPAGTEDLSEYFNVGDYLVVNNVRYLVTAVSDSPSTLTLASIYVGPAAPTTVTRRWAYADASGSAPTTNGLHVVIIDAGGLISGETGTVLETYIGLSTSTTAKNVDGTTAYYVDAINTISPYVRVGGADVSTINSANKVDIVAFAGGVDGFSNFGDDEYLFAYDLFINREEVSAPLIIGGATAVKSSTKVLGSYLIQNIAETRADGIVFVSPSFESCVNNRGSEASDIVDDRNDLPSSSYGHMDSGWKYMYDRYSDVYRWVPLCGDSAGIYARVDAQADTWVPGAGFNRGAVKNVVKMSWSPSQNERDVLYINGINPVTDFPNNGPTLFGDKTMLAGNSAFNRMNVRRLFILLRTTITDFAQDLLFEFNDSFTQNRFVSNVDPFLREVKGRRGITDYRIVADESVNTPAVVGSNRFVGQIYVKAAGSINFIRLDFVAVGQTVAFEEVIGQV